MQALIDRIFPPCVIICFHFQHFQTVHGYDIKLTDGTVKLRRVSCGCNHPALRNLVFSKGFVLQKLQHGRSQCLRHTVDLIQKQNSLCFSRHFHGFVYRCHDLTHGVFRYVKLCSAIVFVTDKRQAKRTLSCVMRHGIGHQCDIHLLCDLLHNSSFSDTRRAKQKYRSLTFNRNAVISVLIFHQINANGLFNLFLCFLYIHVCLSSICNSFKSHLHPTPTESPRSAPPGCCSLPVRTQTPSDNPASAPGRFPVRP